MSLNDKMTKLANIIRSKSLTTDKLGIDDMMGKISDLVLDVDETQNMITAPDDFNNAAWSKPSEEQVGRDSSSTPIYAWITPDQLGKFISQKINDAKANTLYVWKFYARADHRSRSRGN